MNILEARGIRKYYRSSIGLFFGSGALVKAVDGVDLANLGENDLVRYRAEKVGFVFQQFHLVPYLNALENVRRF